MSAARAKLAMFGRESVMDIVALVEMRGASVLSDIFDAEVSSAPPRPFFVLEPSITPPEDQEVLIRGLMTVLMGYLRQPSLDTSAYKNILMNAYSIPESWAQSIADGIDTKDVLHPTTADSGIIDKAVSALENRLDAFRDSWNALLKSGGLDDSFLFWNQSQAYDRDLLYELYSLGEQVEKMQRRGRLMVAQSKAMAGGAFMSGDPGDLGYGDVDLVSQAQGDPDFSDKLVIGDAIRALSLSPVPRSAMGDMASVASAGTKQHIKNLKRLAVKANVDVDAPNFSGPAPVGQGDIASTIIAALTGNIPKLLRAGGAATSKLGIFGTGDITTGDGVSAMLSQFAQENGDFEDGDFEDGDFEDGDADFDDGDLETGGLRRRGGFLDRGKKKRSAKRKGKQKVRNAKTRNAVAAVEDRYNDKAASFSDEGESADVSASDDFGSGNEGSDDGGGEFNEFN